MSGDGMVPDRAATDRTAADKRAGDKTANSKRTVALVGYGTLSHEFCRLFGPTLSDSYELVGTLVRHKPDSCPDDVGVYYDLEDLLAMDPDYVVEFAGVGAVGEYGEAVLAAGSNFVIASVGALADEGLLARLKTAAVRGGSAIYVMSGAVGGFDVLRTLALCPGTHFSIDNIKAPESLSGAPGLHGREPSGEMPEELFRGSTHDAITNFPKNVNVAIASALAVGALDDAEVVIRSVPGKADSTHIIQAESRMARARIEVSSSPDPANPRSSTVTAWSAVALLVNLASPLRFF